MTERKDNLVPYLDTLTDRQWAMIVRLANDAGFTNVHRGNVAFYGRAEARSMLVAYIEGFSRWGTPTLATLGMRITCKECEELARAIDIDPLWVDVTAMGDKQRTYLNVITGKQRHEPLELASVVEMMNKGER